MKKIISTIDAYFKYTNISILNSDTIELKENKLIDFYYEKIKHTKVKVQFFCYELKTYFELLQLLHDKTIDKKNDYEIKSTYFYNCDDDNFLITFYIICY